MVRNKWVVNGFILISFLAMKIGNASVDKLPLHLPEPSEKINLNNYRINYKMYEIVKGDCLWLISRHFYHNPLRWRTIWNANPYIKNPHWIYPKNMLRIPYYEPIPVEPIEKSPNIYYPRADLEAKMGSERAIGRVGFILPLLQNSRNLLFTHLIGLADSNKAFEGNFGLGFRHLFDKFIIGTYAFYDRRRTQFGNQVHQLTVGSELLTTDYEFRVNGYLPERAPLPVNTSKEVVRRFTATHTLWTLIENVKYEVPLSGFDVEAGFRVPKFENMQLFGTYYHLVGKRLPKKMDGFRIRGNYQLAHWLSLGCEFDYDNLRKSRFFAGIQLTWKPKQALNNKNRLLAKMTQPIERDIDIVTEKIIDRKTEKVILKQGNAQVLFQLLKERVNEDPGLYEAFNNILESSVVNPSSGTTTIDHNTTQALQTDAGRALIEGILNDNYTSIETIVSDFLEVENRNVDSQLFTKTVNDISAALEGYIRTIAVVDRISEISELVTTGEVIDVVASKEVKQAFNTYVESISGTSSPESTTKRKRAAMDLLTAFKEVPPVPQEDISTVQITENTNEKIIASTALQKLSDTLIESGEEGGVMGHAAAVTPKPEKGKGTLGKNTLTKKEGQQLLEALRTAGVSDETTKPTIGAPAIANTPAHDKKLTHQSSFIRRKAQIFSHPSLPSDKKGTLKRKKSFRYQVTGLGGINLSGGGVTVEDPGPAMIGHTYLFEKVTNMWYQVPTHVLTANPLADGMKYVKIKEHGVERWVQVPSR